MNIEIANRLVNLRKANNLSQEALAEKLGISRQAVSKWERAEASPDTDNLILLARLYGVSLDELLKTEDEIPRPEPEQSDDEKPSGGEEYTELESFGDGKFSDSGQKYDKEWLSHRHHFPMWVVITVLYFVISVMWNAWHPGWLLFLFIPIWHSLVEAIYKKNPNCFAYPIFVTLVFLCLGFFGFLWHPGWVVFLTIPLYYSLTSWIRDRRRGEEKDHE
ncbi:MAG: helix-turn-helix transcriptional regulator [Lachnospiraceae bacterium]|nr:helix-turn-helix transcriptional regulator [Lachnospiraceae bacterium]